MSSPLFNPGVAPINLESKGPDGVLLLHGWTGSPAHFGLLAAELHDDGYSVVAPLLAGHGTTIGEMLETTWRDWLRSAVAGAGTLLDAGKRLHLVGLSMGGAMALLMTPTFGAVSVTTISAPMKVFDRIAPFLWLLRDSRRLRPHEEQEPADQEAAPYLLHYDYSPIGRVADLFDLTRAAKSNLYRVTAPALIVQSLADTTVRPESALIIREGISSHRKRIIWLEDARHVSLVDRERVVIHREVLAHLRSAD